MNRVALSTDGRSTGPGERAPAATAPASHDLDTVASETGVERAALRRLSECIVAAGAPWQHHPALLRRAAQRLAALRAVMLTVQASRIPGEEAAGAVARAVRVLSPGAAFCLETADTELAAAFAAGRAVDPASAAVMSIGAAAAETAAMRQDHRRAADLYAVVAASGHLAEAVRWGYQYARAALLEERGCEYGDEKVLAEAVDLYQTQVLALAPRDARPRDWAETWRASGQALGLLGQRQRGIHLLQRAVQAFDNALCELDRDAAPLAWAATRQGLGNVTGILGQRLADHAMLQRAVTALDDALAVYQRHEDVSADRSLARYQLATTLLSLGQLTHDSDVLARAIDVCRAALDQPGPSRPEVESARLQNTLGTALRVRGELGGDPRELEQAAAAFRAVLCVLTPERAPADWATAQNNLGAALQRLGERCNDRDALLQAVAAYRAALEVMRRDDAPLAWAMTRGNLGHARRGLAERTGSAEQAQAAIADFKVVAEVFHDLSHPRYYELAKEQLAVARRLAAELDAPPG